MAISPGTLDTVVRADHVTGPPQGRWTVDDLAALPNDGFRYEILDSVLFMSPAPVPGHQRVSGWLVFFFMLHVQVPGNGAIYAAPADLMLDIGTVPQPDVLVILRGNRRAVVGDKRIVEPPDVVIEIASPSTAAYDRDARAGKQAAYARAAIQEYWLVSLEDETLEVLTLDGDHYVSRGVFRGDERWSSPALPDLPVTVRDLFVADPA